MKKFKKLIPAFCMLLISAVLMGTSTFAWFSMNTSVTATGMQVKAATSQNLVISNTENGTFGTTAAADTAAQASMFPATSADGVAFAKNKKPSKAYNDSAIDNLSTTDLETVEATNTTYVFTDTFYIKSEGSDFASLYINNITVTNATDNLAKSLRVAVKLDNGTTYIYAPVSGATTSYSGGNTLTAVTLSPLKNADELSPSLGTVTSTAKAVTVYIWFEGQDASCTSENAAIQTSNYSVDIEFIASAT